jgi:hypothetical protein
MSTVEGVIEQKGVRVGLFDTVTSVSEAAQDVRGRAQVVASAVMSPDSDLSTAPSKEESTGYQHAKKVGEDVSNMLVARIQSVIDLANYLYDNPTNFQDKEVAKAVLQDVRDALSRLRYQYNDKLDVVKEQAIHRISQYAEDKGVVGAVIQDRNKQLTKISDTLESASRKVRTHLEGMKSSQGAVAGVQGVMTDFVNKFGPPQEYVQKQLAFLNKTSNKIAHLENASSGLHHVLDEDEFTKLKDRVEKLV